MFSYRISVEQSCKDMFITYAKRPKGCCGWRSVIVYCRLRGPQGTVLGPLLFLCHINDLPKRVTSQNRLFAVDFLFYRPIRNIEDQLQFQRDINTGPLRFKQLTNKLKVRIFLKPVYFIWLVTLQSFWLRVFTCKDVYANKGTLLEEKIVVHSGLEPATSWLQSKRVPNWATSGDM